MDYTLIALLALGREATKAARKLFGAACYGVKRYLEPYFIAHEEKVKAKTELEIFRTNPLKQLEFAQEFMKNADGKYPEEAVRELTNICKAINAAISYADGQPMDESIYTDDEDKEWYARYFDEVKYISDEELLDAWGRLLAERMLHPKGVNNRVLYFMRNLDKMEIETIRRALRVFLDDDFAPNNFIEAFDGMGKDTANLLALRVAYEGGGLQSLITTIDLKKESILNGKGYEFKVTPIGDTTEVKVSCYALTPEGRVLSRLCQTEMTHEEAQKICDHLNECWKDKAIVEVVKKGA